MSGNTPMMRQYREIKARHPKDFLFYRMGDFYELFLEDAERAAPLLDITLTARGKGRGESIPMCGVPVHSADGYIKRLVELGHRVAICEQVEEPGGGRKLVRREVIEVITPGLVGDPSNLDAAAEVALAAVWLDQGEAGLAAVDASTGNFRATRTACKGGWPPALLDELERIAPRELLVERVFASGAEAMAVLEARAGDASFTPLDAGRFEPASSPVAPHGFDPQRRDAATRAAAAVLSYLCEKQPTALRHAPRLRCYDLGDAMILDAATRRHLELFENTEDRSRRGTLFERINETRTALGARRLAHWMAYPLCVASAIHARQDAVNWLYGRDRLRAVLRGALSEVRDLERIFARCARPGATPRDLAALRASLCALPALAAALEKGGEEDALLEDDAASRPAALPGIQPVSEGEELLQQAIVDAPGALPKGSRGASEIGFIREGYRSDLDELREAARDGRDWISGLEVEERRRSGIVNLKVRFHPVHGYSLEVSKSQLAFVPERYQRKQTLANAERFTTPELSEVEARVRGASERAASLEREILEEVRSAVLGLAEPIRSAAAAVSQLDALQALAEVARRDDWHRPEVDDGLQIRIEAGRHPVVERMLQQGGEAFVPNDTELAPDSTRILLITGPNMAGKSTYLRQVALLVLLAQIGSFLPARSAQVGVVDRIFTRVGASDRLSRGESTFMVEMRETAEILGQASPSSLVILDEIGRGTSTFDGLSLAWAVAEYLHDTPGLGPRTLFATHYHELADLSRTRSGIQNAHFEARESGEDVVFLRRLLPGEANRSYGIQVARLAGLPVSVVKRAGEVLAGLEAGELTASGVPRLADAARASQQGGQAALPLFAGSAPAAPPAPSPPPSPDPEQGRLLRELAECDAERITPMEALTLLARLAEQARALSKENA